MLVKDKDSIIFVQFKCDFKLVHDKLSQLDGFDISKVNALQNEPGYKCKKIHFMQTEMFYVKGGTRIS